MPGATSKDVTKPKIAHLTMLVGQINLVEQELMYIKMVDLNMA